ncbi:hypothetical protein Esti_003562 [Eimeria stiedai]
MRVLAWSDLHLESTSNFELVKQFCKLNQKRPASTAASIIRKEGSDLNPPSKYAESGQRQRRATALGCDYASAGGEACCIQQDSVAQSISNLWESVTAPAASLSEDFSNDVLILAGDVHYEMDGLHESLKLLCSVFKHVAFVPGNHELWVTQKDKEAGRLLSRPPLLISTGYKCIRDSVQKLDSILSLCESLGVHIKPFSPCHGVYVVPLLSWYDEFDPKFKSAARPSPKPAYRMHGGATTLNTHDQRALMSFSENWMDYSACKWPHPLSNNDPRAGAAQAAPSSLHRRFNCESVLTRHAPYRAGHGKQPVYAASRAPTISPPSIFIMPPSADSDRCCNLDAENASGSTSDTSCGCAPHAWPSYERTGENVSLAKQQPPPCPPRKTRDSFGLPLSLADFFAFENERQKCLVRVLPTRLVELPSSRQPGLERDPVSSSVASPGQKREAQDSDIKDDQAVQAASAESQPGLFSGKTGNNSASSSSANEPVVISFSHFLPRAELATIYPLTPSALAYVMGSIRIDEQLREAGSSLHVFGHSHLNVDTCIEVITHIMFTRSACLSVSSTRE